MNKDLISLYSIYRPLEKKITQLFDTYLGFFPMNLAIESTMIAGKMCRRNHKIEILYLPLIKNIKGL